MLRRFCLLCTFAILLLLAGLGGDILAHAAAPGSGGTGLAAVLASTVVVVSVALAFSVPLSLAGAALVFEPLRRRPRLARAARVSLHMAVSVPSVAVGLVGWSLFGRGLGLGYSLLAGGLTLTLMIVPIMTAAFLTGLEAVPRDLREESLLLGLTRWQTFWRLLVPAARPSLFGGAALGLGRATAETAALLFTSGISTKMPDTVLDPGATLAVHIYHLARNVPGGEASAYGAACILFAINVSLHLALWRLQKGRVS